MKAKVMIKQEIDVKYVQVDIAVRYDEEDIPNDFPLRTGDDWKGLINIDTGVIVDWPAGRSGRLAMKVCDQGNYALLDENHKEIYSLKDDYVPNELIPGEYGDYIDLDIDVDGKIKNWPANPNLSDFFAAD